MACTLSNTGIQTGCDILAAQVSQSVDAFTKAKAYDISISGSLSITGSTSFSSSNSSFIIQGISCNTQDHVLTYNCNTGNVTFVCCNAVAQPAPVGAYYTSSNSGYGFEIQPTGTNNSTTGSLSAITSGTGNCIGDQHIAVNASFIGGGSSNAIKAKSSAANNVIGGGNNNHISSSCDIIGGGQGNKICECRNFSSILGGCENIIECGDNTGPDYSGATIVGGKSNKICSYGDSFIGGGICNTVSNGYNGVIVGGMSNTVGENSSFIGAGSANSNSSKYSTIIGGCCNCAKHCHTHILGSDITTCAVCTTHVNNLNAGCTVQLQPRDPIGTGQSGMLTACNVGGGRSKLYYHDGLNYKEVCLVP
jgi:hypothetical protein